MESRISGRWGLGFRVRVYLNPQEPTVFRTYTSDHTLRIPRTVGFVRVQAEIVYYCCARRLPDKTSLQSQSPFAAHEKFGVRV